MVFYLCNLNAACVEIDFTIAIIVIVYGGTHEIMGELFFLILSIIFFVVLVPFKKKNFHQFTELSAVVFLLY